VGITHPYSTDLCGKKGFTQQRHSAPNRFMKRNFLILSEIKIIERLENISPFSYRAKNQKVVFSKSIGCGV